ncbi:hypothetical protein GCM10010916_19030 [Paenibacillus abyssi]|uniref:Uncharacterized protein n=1 Tax=Paenibacillus abyssi TaxID=1340531 RepID=A0A917FTM2_9BACL|nr:hypothetical protein GCM10010916_19030 [Paenibacillus abyssi]
MKVSSNHYKTKRCLPGFRLLTIGWSDKHTFLPLDFALLSSRSSQINGMDNHVDKRTSSYKLRHESLAPMG